MKKSKPPTISNFGAEYFRKFYLNPVTRVVTAAEMLNRAAVISSMSCATPRFPCATILDAGCGIGLLRKPFAKLIPRAKYTGLENSDYLCARFGWKKGSVVDFVPREMFDLVVCYDVLQYLDDRQAARALMNMACVEPSCAVCIRVDGGGLAGELRSHPHGSLGASAARRLVPAAAAAAFSLRGIRCLGAQECYGDSMGLGKTLTSTDSGLALSPVIKRMPPPKVR